MISFAENVWTSRVPVKDGSVLIEESPVLVCPPTIPAGWKKLAKKVSKLEPDRKPDSTADTMPPWAQVTLNEAIIRLLFAFDTADDATRSSVLEMYVIADESRDSPFESLIKKAKAIIVKEGPKIGLSKRTMQSLHEVMRVLTTKVCVTTDGGAVLFRKLGSIQHSCTPNCMFIPRENNIGHLIAIRDIEAGEVINCSHIPTNCLRSSVETRQAWLRGIAGTMCRSDCCTDGFDLRRRVLCNVCHPVSSRGELSGNDQSDLCFAAKSNVGGQWKGLKCGTEMEESAAIDIQKELQLIKKIMILNETDVDIGRLFQYTRTAITEAIRTFGKGHFSYQQLLLLECGLALHSLCTAMNGAVSEVQRGLFSSWVKMLVDVVTFSVETGLPFAGMDELVRILLAPETLQMAVKVMTATKKTDAATVDALSTFATFVDQSCACLVLIEGCTSVHSQDGVKLLNWWTKKYKHWLVAPDVVERKVKEPSRPASPASIDEKSFVSTNADSVETETPKAVAVVPTPAAASGLFASKYSVPIAVGSAVVLAGVLLYSYSRRNDVNRK